MRAESLRILERYMINPEEIDFSSLPSVALRHYRKLPNIGAIYFVLDGSNKVYYVGQTKHLRQRHYHPVAPERFIGIEQAHIAWIPMEDRSHRLTLERRFIRHFLPPFNQLDKPVNGSMARHLGLQISLALYEAIEPFAMDAHMTVPNFAVVLIQEALAHRFSSA